MDNPYWIKKHRFLEMKYFCLQYHDWEREYKQLTGWFESTEDPPHDTTSKDGLARAKLSLKMWLVRDTCRQVDSDIWEMLFRTVIGDRQEIPSSSAYYKKFFYLLDKRLT